MTAVSTYAGPQLTAIIGGPDGGGYHGRCGRAYSPRFLFLWPNARISVMGGEQAASVLATVKRDAMEHRGEHWSAEEEASCKEPIRDAYEAEGNPYYSTARLWDDGIIDPRDTRRIIASSLRVGANAPVQDTHFPVFRM